MAVDESFFLEGMADDGDLRGPGMEAAVEECQGEENVVIGIQGAVLDEDLVGCDAAGY